MSFLDTLKSLGLWQGQGQPQAAQPNPYGLDPQMMQQARMQSLGNIGGQILAMSQQMTPDQRARMMANADWTGGYQTSLYNAAQMKLMGDAQQRRQLEQQRAEEARASIAEMIKKTPPGRVRDAAMYFFQAGDMGKAGELLFKQERRLTPMGTYETVDAFGQPIMAGGSATPQLGAGTQSQPAMVTPPPAAGGAPAPGPSPIPPPTGTSTVEAEGGEVDQITLNWRRLTGDPNLTPQEARQISMAAVAENDPNAGLKLHREIVKNRIDFANKDEDQAATALNQNRNAAEKLQSDFDASTKSYKAVVEAAQIGEQIATDANRSPADKLTVLYRFITTLDPAGSVREGDTQLAQSIQSLQQQIQSIWDVAQRGGPISEAALIDIAKAMGRLGTDARSRMEMAKINTLKRAESRQVPRDMVFGAFERGPAVYPQPPIGYRIRPNAPGDVPAVGLTPEEEELIRQQNGGL